MYRQVLVHQDDRDLQRIVWRTATKKSMQDYQLNTVIYGLACAPYLAIRTLRQLARDEGERHPLAACALTNDVYVDDVLTGAATVAEAQEIRSQLAQLCKAGGFLLKKWAANQTEILRGVPIEHQACDPRTWHPNLGHSTLGLKWHPADDTLSFTAQNQVTGSVINKRRVLSRTAQLFDPLGWLTPVVARAKIFIQSLWLRGLEWDTPLNTADSGTWRALEEELHLLDRIRVPRWLQLTSPENTAEIHGFADASERGYAAVLYLRTFDPIGSPTVSLILAKSRVAPLKQVSLPRLELCGASLLT
ncbi:hypothetical protein RF55_23333, partial [Lasius niger]